MSICRPGEVGSSPLARGALKRWQRLDCVAGLIPARAGSTTCGRWTIQTTWAHPRSRGEHHEGTSPSGENTGSSPLARGAPIRARAASSRCGLIPARTGSTTATATPPTGTWAHPRSRGEHHRGLVVHAFLEQGSSPLARGAPNSSDLSASAFGLIPARAGSTIRGRSRTTRRRAHPRSRGEHVSWRTVSMRAPGSSPLARGALRSGDRLFRQWGLIPARAGSTQCPDQSCSRNGAHPRSRGEHATSLTVRASFSGSSPLARGAPLSFDAFSDASGLIPARAGSTDVSAPT